MSQYGTSNMGSIAGTKKFGGSTGFVDGGMGSTQFNQTQNSIVGSQQTTANLKGKLTVLQEMINQLNEELNFHKKEVSILKSEKETLESVLTVKTQDVRKTITNELFRVEEGMKRHYAHQKAENSRLQQQITTLKGEKTALEQQMLALQRRIAELEDQIGNDED
mmetsp:Transcript_29893/g.26443  ORF Transcript_29893/g.26443 Transcript_29893/m.26443 type:complete len:164 (+) Transcript_29893:27-518(+)|eukprot:CAMPEP_0205802168 /NCGR_PEP_ID=MMETSP0205-20121125/4396_1 /ASSEMBLY_ACC=CAM_ASM_000278 /TAXON_ID=36767 /ORGANISM="Euplotes focardii, Strain TN1" /LENGTH=163 /DNA_ID=CAMNT_0053068125 /DNA_START=19 /DNA_END=510 /DNA_ORIENTATION=-